MKNGPNCGGITGPCCQKHRLEGLEEAHELFPKIFEPFGIKFDKIDSSSDTFFTSLLAIYADFKTQIIVTDLILNSANADSLSHCLENLLEKFYGPAMNVGYLKTKLQQRAVDLRRILEQSSVLDLKEVLTSKFPADLFESNLKNILRNVYNAYPGTFLSEIIQKKDEVVAEVPAATIQSSKPGGVKVAKPVTVSVRVNSNGIISSDTVNRVNNNVKPSEQLVPAPTAVTDDPFGDVIISGKFFRGILEPVDERFAAIIEGRDVNVKQYYTQRKKRAAVAPITKKTKTEENMNKLSLLDRHDSAERISWDTQDPLDTKNVKENSPSEYVRYNPNRLPNSRGRHRFTDKEVANLIEGVRRFGRDWRRIQATYEFEGRSNVDLKDKARNLEKLGLL